MKKQLSSISRIVNQFTFERRKFLTRELHQHRARVHSLRISSQCNGMHERSEFLECRNIINAISIELKIKNELHSRNDKSPSRVQEKVLAADRALVRGTPNPDEEIR